MQEAHTAARKRLEKHRGLLDRVVSVLLEREVLDREAFVRLLGDDALRAIG